MSIKIGVLAPTSNYITCLSGDILQALKLGLQDISDINYELFVESAGYNADKNILVAKIQNLLFQQQVDVVMAPLNAGLINYLSPYCSGQNVPLIVNTLGEDVINVADQNPFLFVNSFNLWQTSWLTGYWGAKSYGKKASSIAAFHDGGYGITLSFAIGLEAQDGELICTTVTHRESRQADPSDAIRMIADHNPNFIMGFYSGKEAVSFLKAYHQLGYRNKYPLIGLPFTVDESLLNEVGELALGIRSLSCWRRDSVKNNCFSQLFQIHTGRSVHAYALMAYETGHLIASAFKQIGSDQPMPGQLCKALNNAEFQGPRGLIKFDPETQEVTMHTHYLQEVIRNDEGQFLNNVIEEIETPTLFYEQLALARKNLTKQGWLNPYLIA